MKLFKTLALLISAIAFTATAQAEKVALDGYCPVCYIAAGKAAKGDSKFSSEYEGKTYHFVSEEVKATFDASPKKWLPAYDGFCAYGVAKGKKFAGDPKVFTVVDGVTYLNFNEDISKKFNKDAKGFITEAEKNWPKVKEL